MIIKGRMLVKMIIMINNELIQKYLKTIENKKTRANHGYMIRKYLKWRNISPEELIENGLTEKDHFERYANDDSLKVKRKSKITLLCTIKKFCVFHKVPFIKFEREKEPLKFADDEYMKKFLTLSGTKKKTKLNTNYQLAKYCTFRNKSPTELIEEAQGFENVDFELHLKEFYDSLNLKTKESFIFTVARFYYKFVKIYGEIIPTIIKRNNNRKKSNHRLGFDKKIVDKETIKQLIEVSDLRDSLIIIAMWESGLNPIDLVSLNYGQMKDYLNLVDPNTIDNVAVIPYTREKNNVSFLACFGKQTLRLMSKWLNRMKIDFDKWGTKITNETPLITMKTAPYERLDNRSVYFVIRKASLKAGFDNWFNCSDFRNSFNTRAKQILKHYDKEMFMGHSGGIERHYDISDLKYFTTEYTKAWELLFDLSYSNEKVLSLEDENRDLQKRLNRMENKNDNLESKFDKLSSMVEILLKDSENEGKGSTISVSDIRNAFTK